MNVRLQLNIQISQGSAATNVRRGENYYSSFLCGSSVNTAVKELLKLVHICQNFPKNKNCTFLMTHGVYSLGQKMCIISCNDTILYTCNDGVQACW